MKEFRVGSWVGASRWPNRAAMPDLWGRPIGGQVMDVMAPQAWANTPLFPTGQPDGALVMNHVLDLRKEGLLEGVVPVMWDFQGSRQIKWEMVEKLRPYSDDIHLWNATRAMRRDELAHPRRRKPREITEFLPQALQYLATA